jgi:carboxyl-terminal processing protease
MGTTVKLSIARKDVNDLMVFDLKRDTIVVKSVELSFKENNSKTVAVIVLSRFGERTFDEWDEAVNQIKNQKSKIKNFGGVVLDMRNNPGGFLNGAVFVASEFLTNGIVVQQDDGSNKKEVYNVNRKGSLLNDPLVVLINGGSASASEIVAGALQETKRAKLVGEKSFGKGTIQEAEDMAEGAGLHITIARWLLPSGKSIDKEGVIPDVEVKIENNNEASVSASENKDIQLDKAVQLLTE